MLFLVILFILFIWDILFFIYEVFWLIEKKEFFVLCEKVKLIG